MPSQPRVTIEALGKSYTFETRGESRQAEEAAGLASQIIRKVETSVGEAGGADKIALLVLAVLDAAGQLVAAGENHRQFVERIGARSGELLSRIPKGEAGAGRDIRPGSPEEP
ncbi:MAG: cell division protein ZapA [Proteobacteria bacterium]|nr:cell division protein ZapA [Pseudomonadota bacterium]